MKNIADGVRYEWDSLRPDDVVFLLAVEAVDETNMISNGDSPKSEAQKLGLKYVRAAEVTQVLDENGRSLRDQGGQQNGHARPRIRHLHVRLDAASYKEDAKLVEKGKTDIYESINIIVRRRGRENNFKPILESIQSLTLADVPLAPWLHEVF